MKYTKLYLNTFIPMMPLILNNNFEAIGNFINEFYNENNNYIKSPVSTNGTFKAHKGEFINLTVDDLIVKNNANIVEDNSDVKNEITFIDNLSTNAASYGTIIDNKCHINVDKYYYNINNYSYIYEFNTTNLGAEIFITFNGDTTLKGKIFLNNNTYVEISFDTTKPYVIPYIKLICTGFIQDKPIWTIADSSYGINNFILKDNSIPELSDLDILRQIRDANPTSDLLNMWSDNLNPYSEWNGVRWEQTNIYVTSIVIDTYSAPSTLPNIKKLSKLETLVINGYKGDSLDMSNVSNITYIQLVNCVNLYSINASGCINLTVIAVENSILNDLNIYNCPLLQGLILDHNKLIQIPTLTNKGNVGYYDFTYNNFPTSELDRFRSLGFTDESKLLPQKE